MTTDPIAEAIRELRAQYPALPVARCGQISVHAPHLSDGGPDRRRICPGSDGTDPWAESATAAPQPATPAQALRWAAECTNCLDDSELLMAMAAELNAAPAAPGDVREAARWLLDAVVAFVLEPDDDDTDEDHDARYRAMCSAADDLRVALDAAPATPGEALDLDIVSATADRALGWVRRGTDDGWLPLSVRTHFETHVPRLAAEVRQLRGELERVEAARANLQRNAEILADEVVLGNAVVTPELDAAPAADPGVPQAGTSEALIEALEVLVYERGMDSTDRDPATCAWLPLMDVVDVIRRQAADPGVYRLPDEPPVGTELWNQVGRWTSRQAPWSDPGDWPAEWCLDGQHYGSGVPWHALLAGGPLSTSPPAAEPGPEVPPVDRSGYQVAVTTTADITRDDAGGTVDARILAGTTAALAYELAMLACDYHPASARQAVIDHAQRAATPPAGTEGDDAD